MRRVAAILTLGLAGSACLAPADDAAGITLVEPEQVVEATDALLSLGPRSEAVAWLRENIPQWNVYLGGKAHDLHPGKDPWNKFTNVYYDDPRDSDLYAPVILVRRGDEGDSSKWVQLSLTQHWMKGDRYFDDLVECGTLTAIDLVVVMGELAKHADGYVEPSPIHVLQAATPEALRDLRYRSRSTCKDENPSRLHAFASNEDEPHAPPLPPGSGEGPDTHAHGPGPGSVDGNGHPRPPVPTSPRPSLSQVPPNPAPPRTAEQNGVNPGDPKAKPSPFDESYKPRPGEMRETFKCAGEVFYGYKAGCLDLSNVSLSMKVLVQGAHWIESVPEKIQALRTKFQDAVINNGTHEDCERHCRYMGYADGFLTVMIVPTACFLITKSLSCANTAGTNVSLQVGAYGAATGLSIAVPGEVGAECIKHVCDGR